MRGKLPQIKNGDTCLPHEQVIVSVKAMSSSSLANAFLSVVAFYLIWPYSRIIVIVTQYELHFRSQSSWATVIMHAHGGAAPERTNVDLDSHRPC